MRNVVAVVVALAWASSVCAASAAEISYHGWQGQVDIANGRFIGCHLNSPPPTEDMPGSPIRIVSNSTTEFFLQFNTRLQAAETPRRDQVYQVKLATLSDHPVRAHTEHWVWPFPVRVLEQNRGGSVTEMRVMIRIPADNEIVQYLKTAKFLELQWIDLYSPLNIDFINLTHRALDNLGSWLGILDTNDTAGAIQTVLDCVRDHGS